MEWLRPALSDKEHIDGLPPGEGVFLACTFWLADNYALQGRRDDAVRVFEQLLSLRNDLGLLRSNTTLRPNDSLGIFRRRFRT